MQLKPKAIKKTKINPLSKKPPLISRRLSSSSYNDDSSIQQPTPRTVNATNKVKTMA